jgi:predicted transcriptional regulator
MTWRIASRREDVRARLMLDMRGDSMSAAVIGRLLGMSDSAVRVITNRIRAADLAESGEPREAVMAAYGWR